MTTDDVFNEWINQQDWIKWKDPKSVKKAFVLWGDYVKDKYHDFKNPKESGVSKLISVSKELATLHNIHTSIEFDVKKEQFFLNLQTESKSEAFVYEDGIVRGRYDYENTINLDLPNEELILVLAEEFSNSTHGRDYYQTAWKEFCKLHGITL